MSRRLIVTAFLVATWSSLPASAGTVSGKIKLAGASTASSTHAAGDKENVVIWLEGQQEATPPDTAVRISQRNLQFSPDFLIAVKGQRVDMPNDDDVAHNVFSFTGMNQFNLGIYARGEYRSVTFDKAGIVDMFCSIHRQMHARIFVVPTKYFASALPGQAFSISDVPAGKYVMKAWHERSRMVEITVTVPRTGVVTENVVLEPGAAPASGSATTAKVSQ